MRVRVRREWIPYLILVAALIVTTAAARYAYLNGTREDTLRFRNIATVVQASIARRLEAYVAMLLGGAGLFAASADVTPAEFRAYVERLELEHRYPGIQGIGFTRLVHPPERDALLTDIGRRVSGFRFWPPPGDGDLNAIVYLEPMNAANRVAFGYDMATEAIRRAAMERARDEGVPAATGRVRLVQEAAAKTQEQSGFLIYVPVYHGGDVPPTREERRSRLHGYVYSPFRTDDLLSGIIEPETRASIGLEVYDGDVTDDNLLHRSRIVAGTERFVIWRTIEIGGRTWTLALRGGERMSVSGSPLVVALFAAGGLVLSILLFLITKSQVTGRIEAERLAKEARRSEERLREVDKEKDAFLATISHELRTPLNAIVGWASMLGRGAVPAETQVHAINVIKRNAAAQTRLIEDLLDMSRAVAGHLSLHVTDVDAHTTLDAALDAFRPAAQAAGVSLHAEFVSRLGMIEADAGRLQQIVMNLLSNAIKFTPAGGRITLRAERAGGSLNIAVTDTGIGIDPKFVPYLFDRFKQADSSPTRAHSGAGLGLAIAKHLVELHRGTIEGVSAGPDAGSTFTVSLPTSRRGKTAADKRTGQDRRSPQARAAG